jgi:uncharacterized protein YkwD
MLRYKLLLALLVLAVSASPALAEIKFSVEEPAADSTKSGIGQISGWAVSDVEIVTVEALIDGVSLGLVPYGGTRQDVAAAFPDFPNSEFSGWAMKWNFSLLEPGEHLVTIIITDLDGTEVSKDVAFSSTSFKSQFIVDSKLVQTDGAQISSPEDGVILISGAVIDGETVDIELKWDTASQQFQISKIVRDDPELENQAPEANAGPGFSVEPGETAVLEGGANDPDGNVVSYAWSQISGPGVDLVNADQLTVEFEAPEQTGSIRLRLKVTDDGGATDQDDAIIEIVEPTANKAPSVDAGPGRTLETNEVIEITGAATDSDGTIVSWYWEQLSGVPLGLQNTETSKVQITAPASAGEARMRLTVTDDDGATDDDEITVTVNEPPPPTNQSPNANAGPDRTLETNEVLEVTGSATDSDGTIVAWQWQQVSGQVVALQNATTNQLRFTAPNSAGTIVLRLTVTDDDGATDDDEVTVTVNEPPPPTNQAPNANAGPNKTVNQGDNVTVTGSGSDPDGTIDEWSWTQVSGPSVNLSGDDGPEVEFTAPETNGDIRLRLTVTDNDGDDDSDDVTITVESGGGDDDTTGETLQSMLATINAARGQTQICNGTSYPAQSPFTWSSSLADIAKQHSMDMASRGYFSHTTLGGPSMGTRVFPYWTGNRVAENIATSSNDRSNSYVVNLWMTSTSGHCEIIMNPDFTHAGVGAGHNENNNYTYHHFWTLDFGG